MTKISYALNRRIPIQHSTWKKAKVCTKSSRHVKQLPPPIKTGTSLYGTDQIPCSQVSDNLEENHENHEGRRFPHQNLGHPTCEASLKSLSI